MPEEGSGFGKVNFSSSWNKSVRRFTNKTNIVIMKTTKNNSRRNIKNHFIIAFGNRTGAGNRPRRVTLVLVTSESN